MAKRENGAALKRRGILAAAGAVVAGIALKQSAAPVLAASLTLETTANIEALSTGLTYTGGFELSGAALNVIDDGGAAFADVPGAMVGGVASTKANIGVFGRHMGSGIGVYGFAGASGNGVFGACNGSAGSYGIHGLTDVGLGVYGTAGSGSGTGVYGISSSAAAGNGNGVYGVVNHVGSTQVTAGVFGDSPASYGIIGHTTAYGYSGCTGIANYPNTAALAGAGTNGAYGAYIVGPTVVQGDFTVMGGAKNAAVRHTDGSYRLMHCVEAPEAWFEDIGEARLVNGTAEVKLDADFAAVVETASYHVFLTPRDANTQGLAVTAQVATGFSVRELRGGTSTLAFSYRIVAKRADIKSGRLARFELPKIRLPKPEEMPPPPAPLPKKP